MAPKVRAVWGVGADRLMWSPPSESSAEALEYLLARGVGAWDRSSPGEPL